MATITPTRYPFDASGIKESNKVVETFTLTAENRNEYNYILPTFAPFFHEGVVIRRLYEDGSELVLDYGLDYKFGGNFHDIAPYTNDGKLVSGVIVFDDLDIEGVYEITYQTLGGQYTLDSKSYAEALMNYLTTPLTTTWGEIVGKPLEFTVDPDHDHHASDLRGYEDFIAVLEKLVSVQKEILDENKQSTLDLQVFNDAFEQYAKNVKEDIDEQLDRLSSVPSKEEIIVLINTAVDSKVDNKITELEKLIESNNTVVNNRITEFTDNINTIINNSLVPLQTTVNNLSTTVDKYNTRITKLEGKYDSSGVLLIENLPLTTTNQKYQSWLKNINEDNKILLPGTSSFNQELSYYVNGNTKSTTADGLSEDTPFKTLVQFSNVLSSGFSAKLTILAKSTILLGGDIILDNNNIEIYADPTTIGSINFDQLVSTFVGIPNSHNRVKFTNITFRLSDNQATAESNLSVFNDNCSWDVEFENCTFIPSSYLKNTTLFKTPTGNNTVKVHFSKTAPCKFYNNGGVLNIINVPSKAVTVTGVPELLTTTGNTGVAITRDFVDAKLLPGLVSLNGHYTNINTDYPILEDSYLDDATLLEMKATLEKSSIKEYFIKSTTSTYNTAMIAKHAPTAVVVDSLANCLKQLEPNTINYIYLYADTINHNLRPTDDIILNNVTIHIGRYKSTTTELIRTDFNGLVDNIANNRPTFRINIDQGLDSSGTTVDSVIRAMKGSYNRIIFHGVNIYRPNSSIKIPAFSRYCSWDIQFKYSHVDLSGNVGNSDSDSSLFMGPYEGNHLSIGLDSKCTASFGNYNHLVSSVNKRVSVLGLKDLSWLNSNDIGKLISGISSTLDSYQNVITDFVYDTPVEQWKSGTHVYATRDNKLVKLAVEQDIFQEIGVTMTTSSTRSTVGTIFTITATVTNSSNVTNEQTDFSIILPTGLDFTTSDYKVYSSNITSYTKIDDNTYTLKGLKKGATFKVVFKLTTNEVANYIISAVIDPNSLIDTDKTNNSKTLTISSTAKSTLEDNTYVPTVECPVLTPYDVKTGKQLLAGFVTSENTPKWNVYHGLDTLAGVSISIPNVSSITTCSNYTVGGPSTLKIGASTTGVHLYKVGDTYYGLCEPTHQAAGTISTFTPQWLVNYYREKASPFTESNHTQQIIGSLDSSTGIFTFTEGLDIDYAILMVKPKGNGCIWQTIAVCTSKAITASSTSGDIVVNNTNLTVTEVYNKVLQFYRDEVGFSNKDGTGVATADSINISKGTGYIYSTEFSSLEQTSLDTSTLSYPPQVNFVNIKDSKITVAPYRIPVTITTRMYQGSSMFEYPMYARTITGTNVISKLARIDIVAGTEVTFSCDYSALSSTYIVANQVGTVTITSDSNTKTTTFKISADATPSDSFTNNGISFNIFNA